MTLAFEKYFSAHHKLFSLPRRRKKTFIERKQLFATAEKVWSLSSTRRKSSSSQNRKHSLTHSLTHTIDIYAHTHTHTHTDTLAANAYVRVTRVYVIRYTCMHCTRSQACTCHLYLLLSEVCTHGVALIVYIITIVTVTCLHGVL